MIRSTLFALVLAALLVRPVHAEAPRPRAVIPAMDAIQVGKTFGLWAPDLRSVLGHDAEGKRRWRLATGDQGGLRELDVLADNLLVYAGAEAILVAPESGKVLGRRPEVRLGAPGGPPIGSPIGSIGCRIHEEEGACALACECSFQVLSCADLSPLGPPATLPRFETLDAEGERRLQCPIFSGALIGRSGDAIITSSPAATDKPFFGVPEVAIARHAKSGDELWRSSELGFFDTTLSGVASDGTCYAASRAGSLIVFDCQRATVLWKRSFAVPRGGEPQVEATPAGLMLRDGAEVVMLDARSGTPRWSAAVPADKLALLAGGDKPAPLLGGDKPAPLLVGGPRADHRRFASTVKGARVLDLMAGTRVADLSFPDGAERWPRPLVDGWIIQGERRIEAFDARGRSLGGLGSSERFGGFAVDGMRIAAWDARSLTLSVLGTTGPSRVIEGPDLRVVGFGGALGAGRLAAFKDGRGPWDPRDPDTFGELRIYDLNP